MAKGREAINISEMDKQNKPKIFEKNGKNVAITKMAILNEKNGSHTKFSETF